MNIIVKNNYLYIGEFKLKCAIGKGGVKKNKIEGDFATPRGKYNLENLYYRKDRVNKIKCNLKTISIKKSFGWCDDPKSRMYNKLFQINNKIHFRYEKLFRKDTAYDYLIPIKYNFLKPKKFKGSAIFIHLTKNYKATNGCIALKIKDFHILCRLINKKTSILIY